MTDCVWLLRHGATDWTDENRHTGREDVPLSTHGRDQARAVRPVLAVKQFSHAFVSPQLRARETCQLARIAEAEIHADLVEWDYGQYEGLTDDETRERHPGWDLFRDGCPGGESPEDIATRCERLVSLIGTLNGTCLLVGHGKLLRALAGWWIERDLRLGSALPMDPAAISVLERESGDPRLRMWNFSASGCLGASVLPREFG